MKQLKYIAVGFYFGFILIKSEAVSWYRIVEMFRFQSFHMFGIIGSAIAIGILSVFLLKIGNISSLGGEKIALAPKPNTYKSNFLGGVLFGLGWSTVGACTAPLFVLVGMGYLIILLPIAAALVGALIFGLLKHKLPY